jgi:molybdopterin/thiamine biosynthesis adenylyltransferase
MAELGAGANCDDSPNPVAPAFAAAFVGAQVFRRVFNAELSDMGAQPIDTCAVDVRIVFGQPGIEIFEIDLGETHVFGVGAVTHGLMWLLEHWPTRVSGLAHLVDQDKYGLSNGQRYTFMRPRHDGVAKAEAMKERLRTAHPSLEVVPHEVDLNMYCARRGYAEPMRRVIAGLDSAEARRHAALKLPERAINMWTEGVRVGAGRYLPGEGSACLACDYLEDASSAQDEVAQISKQTGLRPDIVRELLDTARVLRADEASTVAARWTVSSEILVGQPLRSVLPVLCAMGRVQIGEHDESVDVPFAFASLFAGIAGFMMLLKDITGTAPSEGWTQHVFKVPTPHMHSLRHPRWECVCCAELALD